jgi:hypothetical protein
MQTITNSTTAKPGSISYLGNMSITFNLRNLNKPEGGGLFHLFCKKFGPEGRYRSTRNSLE